MKYKYKKKLVLKNVNKN